MMPAPGATSARQLGSTAKAGRWPLVGIAPAIVALVGVATALGIALAGLGELQRASDDAAALRSRALAAVLAARLRSTALEDRQDLLGRAATRSGAEILLVDQSGAVVVDHALGPRSAEDVVRLLVQGEGLASSPLGRVRFAASTLGPPLGHLSVVTMVAAPAPAEGTYQLGKAVAVLTLLLLGVAAGVALAFMRAARDDVAYVRRRIVGMAQAGDDATRADDEEAAGPAGCPLPVRSLDQVGLVTAAFNLLVTRFAAAERSYRADLRRAAELGAERAQFLAGLSHELRTPLNAVLGFTHLLESEADGPLSADAKEALAQIRTSGEHLRMLIDDILDLSAMETGQLRLERAVVPVLPLAAEVVREARATIKDRPVRLSLQGDAEACAWADPRRLRQVLTNLVSNAVKFTAEGEVRVEVTRREGHVLCCVADTGRGIAADQLRGVFRAYRQAGDAAARREGAGLGLAIARRLVLLHDGRISVSSRLGKGSVFTVQVPDETHAPEPGRDSMTDEGGGGPAAPAGPKPGEGA
ncbi:MAG: HAMP domain-containing histidine kinase [Deltaproteobacteria bacterium]|nr:HAMP domain-containing histidine kinase [Deltaproteobacteria bacterium]